MNSYINRAIKNESNIIYTTRAMAEHINPATSYPADTALLHPVDVAMLHPVDVAMLHPADMALLHPADRNVTIIVSRKIEIISNCDDMLPPLVDISMVNFGRRNFSIDANGNTSDTNMSQLSCQSEVAWKRARWTFESSS
jgi:hypothetical protein